MPKQLPKLSRKERRVLAHVNQANAQGTTVARQQSVAVRQEHYSGPLPRAEDLAKYKAIVPGVAERQKLPVKFSVEKLIAMVHALRCGPEHARAAPNLRRSYRMALSKTPGRRVLPSQALHRAAKG